MKLTDYERVKRWRARHPELWKGQCKRHREKHREEISQKRKLWRKEHPDIRRADKRKWGISKRQLMFYDSLKIGGCIQCGEKDLRCLEFHHVIPVGRKENRLPLVKTLSEATLLERLKGCIVLCANCHRKSHPRKVTPYMPKIYSVSES